MKTAFYTFLFFYTYCSINAQNQPKELPQHKLTKEYTVIINDALSSMKIFNKLNAKKVKNIEVIRFKSTGDPHIDRMPSLAKFGIVKIRYKQKIATFSQRELNTKYNLAPKNAIYFDGFLIDNKDYFITKNAINEIEIIEPTTENKLSQPVLNIWSLSKENRFNTPTDHSCSITNIQFENPNFSIINLQNEINTIDYLLEDYKIPQRHLKLINQFDEITTNEDLLKIIEKQSKTNSYGVAFLLLKKRNYANLDAIYKKYNTTYNDDNTLFIINTFKPHKGCVKYMYTLEDFIHDIYLEDKYISSLK